MARVVISEVADTDLGEIFEWIREASGYAAAADQNAAFDRFYDQLIAFPKSGALRPSLGVDIRIGIVAPYVAPYLVLHRYDSPTDTVFVLRILHGHRDIRAEMVDGTP